MFFRLDRDGAHGIARTVQLRDNASGADGLKMGGASIDKGRPSFVSHWMEKQEGLYSI
jgi:hypothetical protein